ncbi:ATP-grasp domain-containing protein [Alienimonas sp. DA493]|uniref:ATP-grasp domain-containing protein n=1 Tax=Alienimonas sp. DA493 TaxID=3373605 RepID=UPI003754E275
MRVFLSEHLTCGAVHRAEADPLFPEGAAMLRALAADAVRVEGVEVVVTWAKGLPPFGVAGVEVVPVSPSPLGGAFDELFPNLSAECDATLHIAPETGDLLAERAEETSGNWLGAEPDAVRICGDKRRTYDHLRNKRHLPPWPLIEGGDLLPHGPLIMKPRHGAGGAAILFRNNDEFVEGLSKALDFLDWPDRVGEQLIHEQYIPGRPCSVAVINDTPLPAGLQHIQIDGSPGRLSYHGGTVPAADVDQEAVRRLVGQVHAALPGLRGWWGIDFVIPDEPFEGSFDPVLIEVNPRLTTSYLGYRALTPDNLAERLLFPERSFPPLRWRAGAAPNPSAFRPRPSALSTLGLDIGGANLKAADGEDRAASVPFALWQNPAGLAAALGELCGRFAPFDRLAVTMTGELCDCFETKAEGVAHILDAVDEVAHGRPVWVWQTSGEFVDPHTAREFWQLTAAANWHATATFVGRCVPEGEALLIDMGSTTTDFTWLTDGVPVPTGRTDLERLKSYELLYRGAGRTPVCVAGELLIDSGARIAIPAAAELFATAKDAYVALGTLPPDPDDRDTADGRPATRENCERRLARMVCADRSEIADGEIGMVAYLYAQHAESLLTTAVETLCDRHGEFDRLLLAGSGTPVLQAWLKDWPPPTVERITFAEALSPAVSAALPAHAVARLCEERC